MVQMLRKEACSGAIDDLAHIPTQFCLSDPLTKSTIQPDTLIKAISTGKLPLCDAHPLFRSMLQHKAFESQQHLDRALQCLDPRPHKDYWEQSGSLLVRHHVRPRKRLFNPAYATDLPVSCKSLLPVRTTQAIDLFDTNKQLCDTWTQSNASLLPQEHGYWIGTTTFIVSCE